LQVAVERVYSIDFAQDRRETQRFWIMPALKIIGTMSPEYSPNICNGFIVKRNGLMVVDEVNKHEN